MFQYIIYHFKYNIFKNKEDTKNQIINNLNHPYGRNKNCDQVYCSLVNSCLSMMDLLLNHRILDSLSCFSHIKLQMDNDDSSVLVRVNE